MLVKRIDLIWLRIFGNSLWIWIWTFVLLVRQRIFRFAANVPHSTHESKCNVMHFCAFHNYYALSNLDRLIQYEYLPVQRDDEIYQPDISKYIM